MTSVVPPALVRRLAAAIDTGIMDGVVAVLDEIERLEPEAAPQLQPLRDAARGFEFERLRRLAASLSGSIAEQGDKA